MKTKVVAFDVYGTMVPTIGDGARKGLESSLSNCKNEGLIICTCSDGKIEDVKKDLLKGGVNLDYFDKHFKMPRQKGDFTKQPKDFTKILNHYNLLPFQLTVIGDRMKRDIQPARELGCNAILVSEYEDANKKDYFDMNRIKIP